MPTFRSMGEQNFGRGARGGTRYRQGTKRKRRRALKPYLPRMVGKGRPFHDDKCRKFNPAGTRQLVDQPRRGGSCARSTEPERVRQ